jgi:hypothetical protein
MRYQDVKFYGESFGEDEPFLSDQFYIDFSKIEHENSNLKLFVE